MTKGYWELSLPTFIENWPKELCSLSFAQVDVPLTRQDAIDLGSNIEELGGRFASVRADISSPGGLVERVHAAVRKFPDGAFVRLGSRSPKDSWVLDQRGSANVKTGPDALDMLCGSSERVAYDLMMALEHGYCPHIFVRQWIDMPKHKEFRCFLRGRKLVGVSQYDHFHVYPELQGKEEQIRFAIDSFMPYFKEAIHLDDVVFDVFIKTQTVKNMTVHEVKLIEINPFSEMTDPSLYDWRNGGDFDGAVRIRKEKAR